MLKLLFNQIANLINRSGKNYNINVRCIDLLNKVDTESNSEKKEISVINAEQQGRVTVKNNTAELKEKNRSILAVYKQNGTRLKQGYDYFSTIQMPPEHHVLDDKLETPQTDKTNPSCSVPKTTSPQTPDSTTTPKRLLTFTHDPGKEVTVIFQGEPTRGYRETNPATITLELTPKLGSTEDNTEADLLKALASLMANILETDVLNLTDPTQLEKNAPPTLIFRLLDPQLSLESFVPVSGDSPLSKAILKLKGELEMTLYLPDKPEAAGLIEQVEITHHSSRTTKE